MLTLCPDLPDIQGTDGRAVLDTMVAWGIMYETCQLRHEALVELLRDDK